ncbi:iron-containing alcohol dehydrogenase [Aureimonas leprariae]|uniref:Iron-containing alcohol dehydrogenase n=1 Tax=Plantimonas leprariae TaxID=2615207 RepID=A0A7V7PK73_9HYPH|nr:iron-containing alcohol dehydrogenase [Aureimonas leprariae]KAB0676085.1 iron-containing alcohol dehydrogenase [Aureimonas leprariae]
MNVPSSLLAPSLAAPISIIRPRIVEFGSGALRAAARFAKAENCRRILVVADAFNAGRIDALGLPGEVAVFGEVRPEPDVPNLEAAIRRAEEVEPDLVIGFGGGSAMDIAKLVAALAGSGQRIADVVGAEKVAGRRARLMQVPTTAGTGSEAGTRALVTDPASQNKLAVQSVHMLADIAIVDPDLTLSLPPAVTAASGVDAMAHCVEAFTSRKAHPLIDMYALEGTRLVGRYLSRAIRDGSDVESRAGLSLASLYGGFCLGPVNTTSGHAVAYPLGTRHHVAHGAANALVFPHTLAFNAPAAPEKTAAVLEALGLRAGRNEGEVLEAAHRYCADLGCEMRLSALQVPREDLGAMAREAHAIRRLLDNNPRPISEAEILAIYEAAY